MELVLLEVLQQRAAGAMDDALRDAGGARRVQDVQRMVEREALAVRARAPAEARNSSHRTQRSIAPIAGRR